MEKSRISRRKNDKLKSLVCKKFNLFEIAIYDAVEWQKSLAEAWTLEMWNSTKDSRRHAKQHLRKAEKYTALLLELHEANKKPGVKK